MQRYSAENEKMVQQREKSIATLKQQLEDTEKAKVSHLIKLQNSAKLMRLGYNNIILTFFAE